MAGRSKRAARAYVAGDILPTAPQVLRLAVESEDLEWRNLDQAIINGIAAGKIHTADFSDAWDRRHAAWKMFAESVLRDTPIGFEAQAQLDAFKLERVAWAKQVEEKMGAPLPGVISKPPVPRKGPFDDLNLSGPAALLLLVLLLMKNK